jgi:hypothetical protein
MKGGNMGAYEFYTIGTGKTAQQAFNEAKKKAGYESGHGGYTGTIIEKDDFITIKCPKNKKPDDFAYELMENGDSRIDDKWGSAGCIKFDDDKYLFFGWASA